MAQVAYRFTFLDVLLEGEERARDIRAGRARSEPPPAFGRSPRPSPEEAELSRYVRSLPGGLGGVVTGEAPDGAQGQEQNAQQLRDQTLSGSTPVTTDVDSNASEGSLGHAVLCKRPCVHVAGLLLRNLNKVTIMRVCRTYGGSLL